ncbi:sugar ABC transporter ATP-binding protein [Agathobaculum sp. NTUH-O15-33]|uniref:sugar ABC transporter ATP-binding protein n=1 Tax=Agathobaculum sp. NTUH-O15-33 TaxID=3079302 RepID=UPI00295875C4|nr:sugar ABC transporter ATP-binding protein [Agathobaculum sp. NTUH-O15-33]WNX84449.1 sugar ABC transporter ATP-binding protein [Agathobaculum sp. NTUH-O15-33]
MSEYVLEMRDIVKEFPGVRALKGVQLKMSPGTVHALMGENGAGKSTLMKCLIGIYQRTSGTILFDGKEVSFRSPLEALNSGISMIHQELMPVPERTVAQNVWVGREPKRGPVIDHKKMREDTAALFREINFELDPEEKMGNLTVAQMQMVEICKAFSYRPKVMILDEPTSSLTEGEVAHLFEIIRGLKAQGCALIYISHKMDEIFQICDEVTVLRDGEYVSHAFTKDTTVDALIASMVGREVKEMFPKVDCPIGEVVLKVENLCSGRQVQNVSFDLRRGEILGFAGLVGAGRTETVETIFGMRTRQSGAIWKDGKELHIKRPEDAIAAKIGLLTEDRRKNGIVGVRDITANTVLAHLKAYGLPMNHKKIREDTDEFVKKLNVKTPNNDQLIMYLSGGNQQKVLVGRWLLTDPDILIVDEPTRGIDVGAKAEIHSLLTQLAGTGKSIIMISSELPEVMGMSDRMVVMYEGAVTGIVERNTDQWNSEHIMALCHGEGSTRKDAE